jgi:hypothetical protein
LTLLDAHFISATINHDCRILTKFLVDRLDEMGSEDTARAALLLRLFKLLFGAVTLFPDQNESVLQPYLSHLITRAMEMGVKSKYAPVTRRWRHLFPARTHKRAAVARN